MTVQIHESARKHGISDADILHALEHAVLAAPLSEDKVLHLGADLSGNMIEAITVIQENRVDLVIHAMKMRKIYASLLTGGESNGR